MATPEGGWRLFLALPLAGEVAAGLARAIGELRGVRARVTWVRPEAMHLTVKFLGDTPPDRVPPLSSHLLKACSRLPPVAFEVAGTGSFPPRGLPRVLWAGVASSDGTLPALARAVEDACSLAGFPREARPFSPHLTLGRVRGGMFLGELSRAVESLASRRFGAQSCSSLALFRSTLGPSGPLHEELSTFPLQGPP